MKIAICASDLNNERWDGTKVYLYNILKQFKKIDRQNQYLLYVNHEPLLDELESDNFRFIVSHKKRFWLQRKLPAELRRDKPDVLWMPLQTLPYIYPRDLKTVVTIHDLGFKQYPDAYENWHRLLLNLTTRFAVKKSDALIAVSKFTKDDIVKKYGVSKNKIKVVHHAFDRDTFNPNPETAKSKEQVSTIREKFNLLKPYIMFLGGIRKSKNLLNLVESFEKLKDKYKLPHKLAIVGGKAWVYDEIIKRVRKSEHKDDIVLTGQVDTHDVQKLFWEASCFAFPSLWEGFGIPILEAQACGVPVLTSNVASMPEAGGEGAHYIDPESTEEMTEGLHKILTDESYRRDLVQKGFSNAKNFSWEKAALKILDVILKVGMKSDDIAKNNLVVEAQELIKKRLKALQKGGLPEPVAGSILLRKYKTEHGLN